MTVAELIGILHSIENLENTNMMFKDISAGNREFESEEDSLVSYIIDVEKNQKKKIIYSQIE